MIFCWSFLVLQPSSPTCPLKTLNQLNSRRLSLNFVSNEFFYLQVQCNSGLNMLAQGCDWVPCLSISVTVFSIATVMVL